VIAHLVLYELREDASDTHRARLRDALLSALTSIPSVRRVRLGRRALVGASYEQQMPGGFTYFALFEFADDAGLRAYLEHPAHAELGTMFWQCCARTLVLDYELAGDDLAGALRGWG
jgi:hypothetical protein